ncbi:MAG: ATP synthase F1 subunit delta [Fusobacteriaceae bacterium]
MVDRVGNRYAEAIYHLALEEKKVSEIHKILQEVDSLYKENMDFKQFLTHPLIGREEKHNLISKIFGDEDGLEQNILFYLIDKGRINEIKSIAQEFKLLYYKDNNITDVKAIFAKEISSEQKERLVEKLKKSTGKTINLEVLLEPELIGGGIIRIGDKVIDGSIRSQLQTLGRKR